MKKKLIPVLLVFTLLLLLLGGGNVLATTDSTSRALDPVVSTSWLAANKNKVVILDVRSADDYKAGHIPTAKSLPTPWIWEEDGTYRSMDILDLMASGVAGEDKDKEIILYCGAGGYASSWWFLLTQQMGYKNVKFYDGSAQDWVKHNFMIAYLYS